MEELLVFIIKVRKAFEQDDVKGSYVGFHDFPRGSCMDASILLGVLLEERLFGNYQLISAWNDLESHSHAWLENETHIIDVTADQFVTWPVQSLILEKTALPQHYAKFDILWREPVFQHRAVPDLGYYTALNLVKNAVFFNQF
ncbi:hypothetical protein BDD43_0172 [Mucilaginibacter gracilis]|uniref:Transglutaminase superfamily protein n=1 Tax=Mucilaginibacter gracilis TaxID=423350 RepID=A0A495IW38_9SPHI|nr:hypothetical protein [Mucilaginibacter gracilis]RKR80079.1 hypothetical protein BDD43_0172 [Mucilaginibacter gracilis]